MELLDGSVTSRGQDVYQKENAPFANVLTCTIADFTYAEKTDMHYMYGRANGNDRDVLRMYHTQFRDRRTPDHRFFSAVTPST